MFVVGCLASCFPFRACTDARCVPDQRRIQFLAFGDVQVNAALVDPANAGNSRADRATGVSSSGDTPAITRLVRLRGPEDQIGCGTQHTASVAEATADVFPQQKPELSQGGFVVHATAKYKGGFYRGRVLAPCSGSHNTIGRVDATAKARLEINFSGPPGSTDTLLVHVAGATADELRLSVTNPFSGASVALGTTDSVNVWKLVLPGPGNYHLAATMTLSVANGGATPNALVQSRTVAVTALALSPHVALPPPSGVVTVDIVPGEIQRLVASKLFTTQGKYYPFKSKAAKDLYLENPVIHLSDQTLTLSAHLTGMYNVLGRHGVSAVIGVKFEPDIDAHGLHLSAFQDDIDSDNGVILAIEFLEKVLIGDRALQNAISARTIPIDSILEAKVNAKLAALTGALCVANELRDVKVIRAVGHGDPGVLTVDVAWRLRSVSRDACAVAHPVLGAASVPNGHRERRVAP
jgi:hypothetical protein